MNAEATTREEYLAAFAQMNKHAIIGEHTIGQVKVVVGPKRWKLTSGPNEIGGPVKSGAQVRYSVNLALNEWLNGSGIR